VNDLPRPRHAFDARELDPLDVPDDPDASRAAQCDGAPRGSSATYGSSSAILSTTR
jgi:hypothetical protein